MNVHVLAGMFGKDFDGALFVCSIPCPHPQQQASVIQLFLQIPRVVIGNQLS
jgi:hypothetical protein